MKAAVESKTELLEKLRKAEIENRNQIYQNWDFEEKVRDKKVGLESKESELFKAENKLMQTNKLLGEIG